MKLILGIPRARYERSVRSLHVALKENEIYLIRLPATNFTNGENPKRGFPSFGWGDSGFAPAMNEDKLKI